MSGNPTFRNRRGPGGWLLVALACALSWTSGPVARAGETVEYAVKAAFLYNFAKFASWPEDSFAHASAPLQFCALGDAPFGRAWDALEGKRVRNRSVTVRKLASVRESAGCQLIFVSKDRQAQVRELLEAVESRPVLIVGESEGFCEDGGTINFVIRDGKVRFQINPDAGQRAGIRLGAQLLRLAEIVSGKRGEQ